MIYKNQTALTIKATCYKQVGNSRTQINLTGATVKYIRTNGNQKEFNATITDAIHGETQYEVQSENDIDETGVWRMQPEITFPDTTKAKGEPFEFVVK